MIIALAWGLLACVPAARHEAALAELEAARAISAEHRAARDVSAELARLYHEDRWDRSGATDWRTLELNDAERLARVRALDAAGRVQTPTDRLHAALILQHGVDSADYWRAYELARAAAEAGVGPARPLAMQAWDRWRLSEGAPQDYGTQTRADAAGRRLYAVSGEVDDAQRALWRLPPLEVVLQQVLDANGKAGPPTMERLRELGLLIEPGVTEDAGPPVELTRCLDFEGAEGTGPFEADGIRVEGGEGLAERIEGDLVEGSAGLVVAPGGGVTIHLDPPIALYRFNAVALAGGLRLQGYAGERALLAGTSEIQLGSEGWAAGGRTFASGFPDLADRIVLESAAPTDRWGLDAICVGP